jgi:hypothetical protein
LVAAGEATKAISAFPASGSSAPTNVFPIEGPQLVTRWLPVVRSKIGASAR